MSAEPADVTLSVDGKEVTVPAGTLIIRAAEQLGIEIRVSASTPCSSRSGRAASATSRWRGSRS